MGELTKKLIQTNQQVEEQAYQPAKEDQSRGG